MPIYTEFLIDFSKVEENAAQNLLSIRDKISGSDQIASIQAESLSQSLDILQQDRIFADRTFAQSVSTRSDTEEMKSIYGKAKEAHNSNKLDEIAETYQMQSNSDARRFSKLELIIDGSTTTINEIATTALSHHNEITHSHKTTEDISIDMIADYLQDTQNIAISEKQRNFLRTQWNQMSVTGIIGTLQATGAVDHSSLLTTEINRNEQHNIFVIKKGKLISAQYSATATEIKGSSKSGTFRVTADLSNLAGERSENNPNLKPEDWLPKNKAKISLLYISENGLGMRIAKPIAKVLKVKNPKGSNLSKLKQQALRLFFSEKKEKGPEPTQTKSSSFSFSRLPFSFFGYNKRKNSRSL